MGGGRIGAVERYGKAEEEGRAHLGLCCSGQLCPQRIRDLCAGGCARRARMARGYRQEGRGEIGKQGKDWEGEGQRTTRFFHTLAVVEVQDARWPRSGPLFCPTLNAGTCSTPSVESTRLLTIWEKASFGCGLPDGQNARHAASTASSVRTSCRSVATSHPSPCSAPSGALERSPSSVHVCSRAPTARSSAALACGQKVWRWRGAEGWTEWDGRVDAGRMGGGFGVAAD